MRAKANQSKTEQNKTGNMPLPNALIHNGSIDKNQTKHNQREQAHAKRVAATANIRGEAMEIEMEDGKKEAPRRSVETR